MNKIAFTISLALLSATAQAASSNQTLNDQLALRIGPFFPSIDTSVKIGDQEQNFEDYLDDSATTAAIKGVWRFSKKLRLDIGYWAVERDSSESLSNIVIIGSTPVPPGTAIGATFDTSLLSASLGWSFVRTESTEFGVDLGLSSLSLKSELGAAVPGVGSASFTVFDESYLLPTIGVYITQALSPMWSLTGRIGGVGLDLGDDFKGSIIEAMGAVEFRPWENVGFGLAYVYNDADAELKNLGAGLDVKWNYAGPFAYLTLGFGDAN